MYTNKSKTICAIILFFLSFNVFAGNKKLNVFFTQGYVYNTENQVILSDFRELGINTFFKLNDRLSISAQTMNKQFGRETFQFTQTNMDYLFLNYIFNNDFNIKLGRIVLPYGIYNETRNVAFIRPTVMLPQNIYGEDLRFTVNAIDGGVFEYSGVPFSFRVGYGYNNPKKPGKTYFLLYPFDEITFNDAEVGFLNFRYATLDQRLRLSYSFILSSIDSKQKYINPMIPIEAGDVNIRSNIFSVEYVVNSNSDVITFEIAYNELFKRNFGVVSDDDPTAFPFYIQYLRRVNPKTDLVFRYEHINTSTTLPFIPGLDSSVFSKGHAYNIGLNYRVNRNLFLQTQVQYNEGTSVIPNLELPLFLGNRKYPYMSYMISATVLF